MKLIYLVLLASILTGCSTTAALKDTDPFRFEFSPIASASVVNPEAALSKTVKLLEKEGYLVSSNAIFHTATTEPKNIGYQYWKVTNEKWNVSYQLGVQIIEAGGVVYWKLSHKIIGSRSGKQDRTFDPADFDVTEQKVNEITRKLMNLFSASA